MAQKDFSNERLIQQVEIERQKFDENTCALTEKQSDTFNVWYDLLREEDTALAARSKQRRS